MKTNNKGFSLVELIVVIAIMAILAAVAIPTFSGFIKRANVASDESFINDVEYAITIAHAGTPDDKITEFKVTASDGVISTVTYKVGGDAVEIDVSGGVGTLDKAATADARETDAGYVVGCIDWSYTFKSTDYASGSK